MTAEMVTVLVLAGLVVGVLWVASKAFAALLECMILCKAILAELSEIHESYASIAFGEDDDEDTQQETRQ